MRQAQADEADERRHEEMKLPEEFPKRFGAKKCIQCLLWVEQISGKDHMTCMATNSAKCVEQNMGSVIVCINFWSVSRSIIISILVSAATLT